VSYVLDSLQVLMTTIRNVFRPPTTVDFPRVKRERPERSRVSFALVHDEHGEEACIGCFLCEKICPSDVITVKAAGKRVSEATGKKRGYCEDFTLDLNGCIYCELCVQVCPTDAILMTRTHQPPTFSREGLVLTMDKLYANEADAEPTWATGSKLLEMQNPKRGAPVAPKKAAKKPAAAKPAAAKPAAAKPAAAKPAAAKPAAEPVAGSSGEQPPASAPSARSPDGEGAAS